METTINDKLTLTVKELQTELNIGRNSAYQLVSKSDFPKIYIGKKIIIPRQALNEWLLDQIAVS